ncbi:phenolic glucoside malonyltransferase 2-like [Glycine soja]|uniref:phenolic glucoside malonyltransferase 2-like n=1 Tax=Glycine soja TaxID=3848 RepID=UPI00103C769D|nr:phenolic glucoside malonyltransferase 2-like [Glycine soja]
MPQLVALFTLNIRSSTTFERRMTHFATVLARRKSFVVSIIVASVSCCFLGLEIILLVFLPLAFLSLYQIGVKFINDWLKHGGSNSISLMVWDLQPSEDASRGSSKLSRSDVEKLKQSVVSKKKKNTNLHLSSFVLSIAYAWVCRVRAEEIKNKSVALALTVDCRWRLEPPLPATYFGNCVGFRLPIAETRELLGEEGLVVAVEAVSDTLETLKDGAVSGAENWSSWLLDGMGAEADVKKIGVAGSPRFEVYSSDFGWGRPKKVEMVSIEKTAVFGLSDSRNGDGIEIGFASLFVNGLESRVSLSLVRSCCFSGIKI